MGEKSFKRSQEGQVEIHPLEAGKIWSRWLENIRDWCLSRQLWWDHRIPAYKSPSWEVVYWADKTRCHFKLVQREKVC
ncbi:valvl tRNA synthetase [Nosema bombycis CQ1]|uniref:valine--tRNA ligase n=1 Tax=Nosema bombycis (strain CQ1 / CVCC 102059) TaxID=578461 RepID=R0M258_NOSB1|nr:valvl tRNA synthetase [Nosema bombycis CQ1]|eukprot:EOB12119.1 valvl tRNA synthetase [Nosema bombycis CQ1]